MLSSVQALFLTAALVSLMTAGLIHFIFRQERDQSAQIWVAGSLLMALGMLLLIFRSSLPDWLAFGVTNYVMLQGVVLYGQSFSALYLSDFKISTSSVGLCVLYGLTQFVLHDSSYAEYLALVASLAWMIAHGWIFFSMLHVIKLKKDAPVRFFALLAVIGMVAWGTRAYLVALFDVSLSTDLSRINFYTLLVAHFLLLAQQSSYMATRVTEEKTRKSEVIHLNSYIKQLYGERAALVQEKETARMELLQEVHDGFGSKLLSTQLLAERGILDQQQLNAHLKDLMSDLHLLVDTLNQKERQFQEALADFRYRVQRLHPFDHPQIHWQLHLEGMPEVEPKVSLQLLRILQEALSNALKHAQAENIRIIAGYEQNQSMLTLKVTDDGKGWTEQSRTGHGLHNMQNRARKIGANLVIHHGSTGTDLSIGLAIVSQPRAKN